jgi:CheY-like chemotaxis protein
VRDEGKHANGQMACILLVEDDVDVRAVMEHILIDAGYEVDAAGSEGGALDLL